MLDGYVYEGEGYARRENGAVAVNPNLGADAERALETTVTLSE